MYIGRTTRTWMIHRHYGGQCRRDIGTQAFKPLPSIPRLSESAEEAPAGSGSGV